MIGIQLGFDRFLSVIIWEVNNLVVMTKVVKIYFNNYVQYIVEWQQGLDI